MAESHEYSTVIGADADFKGELSFESSAKVLGKFEGAITSKGKVHIADGSKCRATITAKEVIAEGRIDGNVEAGDRIEIKTTGAVIGDIVATRMIMAEGASVNGHCRIGPKGAEGSAAGKASSSAEPEPAAAKATASAAGVKKVVAKAKKGIRQEIRCYLCGHRFEVSAKAMSTTCAKCHKAIKVEDIVVKSYMPVNDVQTCGRIKVTRRGRIAARIIQSGDGIDSEGSVEGSIETEGDIQLGPKSVWKGKTLRSRTLQVTDGAQINGRVRVPWDREDEG